MTKKTEANNIAKRPAGTVVNGSAVIAQVRDLAWAGQHVKAIEMASQGLLTSKIKINEQIGLLDLRAESYIAHANLDLAAKDAAAMVKLAKPVGAGSSRPALTAQALNRKAIIQMRRGEIKPAIKTVTAALKAAKQTKHKALEAESLLILGEAQFRASLNEQSVKSGQQAADLFEALKNPSGQGRADRVIAIAHVYLGNEEKSRIAAKTALAFCQQAGDQYGIGNALNAITFTEADVAENIKLLNQARQAFESAGYLERLNAVTSNIGNQYLSLGLFQGARRFRLKDVQFARQLGDRWSLTNSLLNLASLETLSGHLDAARSVFIEFKENALALDNPNFLVNIHSLPGMLAMKEGDPQSAIRHYKKVLRISQEAELRGNQIGAFADLGEAHLAAGEPAKALTFTTRATKLHRAQGSGAFEGFSPANIYWQHSRALTANKKNKEARAALEQAYQFLLESISTLSDEGFRRNYLNKDRINREILEAWIQDRKKKKLAPEKLSAHLAVEADVREPFKRLADTGLRLNALKTVSEIQTFLVEEATELSGGERVLLILEKDGVHAVTESILPNGENAQKVLRGIEAHLAQARRSRIAQLVADNGQRTTNHRPSSIVNGLTRIVAPLIAQNQVIGYLYADMDSLYGTFNEVDRDMLGMLANQAAVALDNAQWAQGLEQKVEERTAELQASNANLEERNSELAIINSVQAALAAELNIQGIYDAVGDKIREIFNQTDMNIRIYDPKTNLVHYPYLYENGERIFLESSPLGDTGFEAHIIRTHETLVINENFEKEMEKYGSYTIAGTQMEKSIVFVPLVVGEQARGMINLLDMQREHAFSESDVRLLTTLANAMSVALENARLFDETQRLLKITEDRAAELAIINSVQAALAAELNIQGIYDAVGDKIREIFHNADVGIRIFDLQTRMTHFPYSYENGERISIDSVPLVDKGLAAHVFRTRETLVINEDFVEKQEQYGGYTLPGTETEKSMVMVPLIAGEQVRGTIDIGDYQHEQAFSESDVRLLQTLANAMSVALENARLFDETQRLLKITEDRAAELAIINSVQEGLASKLEMQAIYDLIGDKIRDIFDAQVVDIGIYDRNEKLLHFPYTIERGVRFPDEPMELIGFRKHVIETQQHLLVNSNVIEEAEKYGNPLALQGEVSKACLYVPMLVGGEVKGVLSLQNLDRENAFTESDVSLLTTLTNAMSVALENARLFDETQRLLKITEERNAELAVINSVQEGLASKLEFQSIIDLIGDKVTEIFNAQATLISLYNPAANEIDHKYLIERGERIHFNKPVPIDKFRQRVVETRQPWLINSDYQKVTLEMGEEPVLEGEEPKSLLFAPMIVGDIVTGIISLQNLDVENAFNDSDVRLLSTIAASMSVALENARLFEETQRLLKITEERAQELAVINSVQEGLASKLFMQAIYDLIGDKIRDIFEAQTVMIVTYDNKTNLMNYPYIFESGDRLTSEPLPLDGTGVMDYVITHKQSIMINTDLLERTRELTGVEAVLVGDGQMTKSRVDVPMIVGGEVKGGISLQNVDRENAFTDADLRLLQTLTNAMSVALENARLFDETQRLLKITEDRAAELAIINSVQEGLASKLIMQAIYDLIGDKIRDIFDAQVVDIGIYDRNEKLLHFPYTIERGMRFPDEPLNLIGYRKHVMETHQPLLINEDAIGAAAKYGNPLVVQGELPQSLLFVPMLVGGEAVGVLSLQNLDREHAFSESDVSLLTTLTNAMSVALENARLFDETQRLLQVTEERAAELGAISKVSQALIVESELDSTIQLIGSQMREIFSADIVYLALLDQSTNLIHFPYQFGEAFEPLAYGEGLTSKIIQTGEPLLINQDLNERAHQIGVARVGKEALSYLGVPIKTSKGTIGVISVQSTTQEGIFTDDSLRLLTTIAANAGAALHNAQLFSEALENLRQVEILTNAASAIELSAYEPAMVESVAARTDALGELARVFAKMADEVRMREQRLKRQLAQMQLDIEEKKLAKAETVAIYIPMDRRQAMEQHVTLPERAHGAALFADVSGFTALTESLANELGLQRGAEEMIRHLNRVFTVLIDEVHRYSGAVISFSGDAITCWFDDLDLQGNPRADSSLERAAACAFAMQKGMTQFAAISTPNGKTIGLSIKVALAVGPTRRMVVGDGSTHQLDVLAGATLTALADAEHESERGEVVLAAANLSSFATLEETFNVAAWREEKQFAVLTSLKNEIAPSPWAEIGADAIIKSRLRPWMHPTVFEKVRAGQSEMLSELRPATALFMKFGGLDYDHDPEANKKLNAFIQWVEAVIAQHNGSIIQFTVGDKGSYIYIVFGAPIAHRDDAAQAVFTALELASPPESLSYMTDLFIGLASGQMRVGAYGGAGHRTYGAIGDRTNLAARLMVAASVSTAEVPEGQRALILCNDSVHDAAKAKVEFESMPRINVKGKTDTIAVYRPLRKLGEHEISPDASFEHTQRIDDLPAAEQLTLKVASVIGPMFTFESLSAVHPEKHASAALQKQLQTLSDLGLIHKRPNEISGYNFKDQQTHEAAYNLMLFAQRRQLHRAVAELLEQTVFSVPPYAEIAHHWQSANEIPKAIEYLEKAGEHARQMGDIDEAKRFFNESLGLNS